jgi:hypothetical protein
MGITARYFYTAVYTSNIYHPFTGRLSVVGYIVSSAYSYLCFDCKDKDFLYNFQIKSLFFSF